MKSKGKGRRGKKNAGDGSRAVGVGRWAEEGKDARGAGGADPSHLTKRHGGGADAYEEGVHVGDENDRALHGDGLW